MFQRFILTIYYHWIKVPSPHTVWLIRGTTRINCWTFGLPHLRVWYCQYASNWGSLNESSLLHLQSYITSSRIGDNSSNLPRCFLLPNDVGNHNDPQIMLSIIFIGSISKGTDHIYWVYPAAHYTTDCANITNILVTTRESWAWSTIYRRETISILIEWE